MTAGTSLTGTMKKDNSYAIVPPARVENQDTESNYESAPSKPSPVPAVVLPVSSKALMTTQNKDKNQLTKDANSITKSVVMSRSFENNATDSTSEIAASSSQAGPSRSAEDRLREDAAIVERISSSAGVERVEGRLVVTPLHVVFNLRVMTGDILRDYPACRMTLHE